MTATFSFDVDPTRDLVRITMSGFFEKRDIDAFLDARREAHKKLRCGPNAHLTLNDLRGMKIQSSESVAAFRDMLGAPEYRSRRLAFVIESTLARAQLLRVMNGRKAQCFDDPVTAEAWLLFGEGETGMAWRATG